MHNCNTLFYNSVQYYATDNNAVQFNGIEFSMQYNRAEQRMLKQVENVIQLPISDNKHNMVIRYNNSLRLPFTV